jgi:hypothetical protein
MMKLVLALLIGTPAGSWTETSGTWQLAALAGVRTCASDEMVTNFECLVMHSCAAMPPWCRGRVFPNQQSQVNDVEGTHTHRRAAVDGAGNGAAGAARRRRRLQEVVAQQLDGRRPRPGVPVAPSCQAMYMSCARLRQQQQEVVVSTPKPSPVSYVLLHYREERTRLVQRRFNIVNTAA